MKIPVRNLFYLLTYAWDAFETKHLIDRAKIEEHDALNLLAKLLESSTTHLLRKGLDRGYIEREQEIAGIRGKLNVSASVSPRLLPQGRALCSFDEFQHDVVQNQILKATLRELSRSPAVKKEQVERLPGLYRKMNGVRDIQLTHGVFRKVRLHRNNAYYRLALSICELIYENRIVNAEGSGIQLNDFERDPRQMRRLFERFVFHFAKKNTPHPVSRPHIPWEGISGNGNDRQLLPRMETDVVIQQPNQTLLIDTKFTARSTQNRYETRKLRSGHLYQLYTYTKNMQLAQRDGRPISGMLLYPSVGEALDMRLEMQGMELRVATLDLSQSWQNIHEDLLSLVA